MGSLNSCSFTGNLTRDAETKVVGESEVASFAIAVNGRNEDDVLYLNCDMWRPGRATEFLTRGKQVAVSGRLKCRRYEKDGQKREAWGMEVKDLALLGSQKKSDSEPF